MSIRARSLPHKNTTESSRRTLDQVVNIGVLATRAQDRHVIEVPSVDEIEQTLKQMSDCINYIDIVTPMMKVQLRKSCVPRRGNSTLDYDIVQIAIEEKYQKQGNGVQFFKNMVEAAARDDRGVYIEQCITDASQAWRKKLISQGIAHPFKEDIYGPYNAISANFMD